MRGLCFGIYAFHRNIWNTYFLTFKNQMNLTRTNVFASKGQHELLETDTNVSTERSPLEGKLAGLAKTKTIYKLWPNISLQGACFPVLEKKKKCLCVLTER